MKKAIFLLCLLAVGAVLFAQVPAVFVADFNVGNHLSEQNAVVMANLFRSELVRSGRFDMVARERLDNITAEMKFQMEDRVNPDRVKRFGQLLGADYLVFGTLSLVGRQYTLTVEMIDMETSVAIVSERLTLGTQNTMEEFERRVGAFAGSYMQKFPKPNNFVGEWESFIGDYHITILLMPQNRASIIISTEQGNEDITEEARGTWSFNDNTFRLSGNFSRSNIRGLGRINWNSVYTFTNNDNSEFNMMVTPPGGRTSVRATFTRTSAWE